VPPPPCSPLPRTCGCILHVQFLPFYITICLLLWFSLAVSILPWVGLCNEINSDVY
jgi:hypothetical protein